MEREEGKEYIKYSGKYELIKYNCKAESSFLQWCTLLYFMDTGLKLRGHDRALSRDTTPGMPTKQLVPLLLYQGAATCEHTRVTTGLLSYFTCAREKTTTKNFLIFSMYGPLSVEIQKSTVRSTDNRFALLN